LESHQPFCPFVGGAERALLAGKSQTLCSYDQFSNMVLEDTIERRHVIVKGEGSGPGSARPTLYYSDIPLGLFVVRGESIVIMGRTNPSADVGDAVGLQELEDLQKKSAADDNGDGDGEEVLQWDVDADLVA
jgi:U6 snRNA-associated Sm-like protein LSm1